MKRRVRIASGFMAAAMATQALSTSFANAADPAPAPERFSATCVQHIDSRNVRSATGYSNPGDVRIATGYGKYLETEAKRDDSVMRAILNASEDMGIDYRMMLVNAMIESDLGRIKEPSWVKTSMRGLYQYPPQTWRFIFKHHGAEFQNGRYKDLAEAITIREENGIEYSDVADSKKRQKIDDLRMDFEMAAFIKAAQIRHYDIPRLNEMKPNPTMLDFYMMHFLGEGNARKFFKGLLETPDKSAASVLEKPARFNRPLFYDSKQVTKSVRIKKKGKKAYYAKRTVTESVPLSFKEVYERIDGRLKIRENQLESRAERMIAATDCLPAMKRLPDPPPPVPAEAVKTEIPAPANNNEKTPEQKKAAPAPKP